MIAEGDRARHQRKDQSFGEGTVLAVNPETGVALVEWDSHRVARLSKQLTQQQTHVETKNLVRLDSRRRA
jgi:hypothetical protein